MCDWKRVTRCTASGNDAATPIETGNRWQVGLNVSGGTDRLSYVLSDEFRMRGGLRLPRSTEASLHSERGNLIRPDEFQ